MNTTLLAYAFLGITLLELTLYAISFYWRHVLTRRLTASVYSILLAAAATGMFCSYPTIIIGLIGVISLYRVLNLVRITENRANVQYLRRATSRTALVLIVAQAALFGLQLFIDSYFIDAYVWLYGLVVVQLAVALTLLVSTIRRIAHTKLLSAGDTLPSSELPSVTIAIPARNETEDLQECLHSLIDSDYPKLEILVLDDCSQLRRTPEIIRSFAHDGVRFVKGDLPRENWLAKNQAYEKLTHEASGEIILFCGVDTRFGPGSVHQLVTELKSRKKRMLSILPLRRRDGQPQHAFVQSARYLWELTPPRRLFKRPPVLSSCWLIYKKDLKKYGGFAAVSRMIMPEAYFAKKSLANDGYSFLRANEETAVVSVKSYEAQRSTAIRMRYPQLRRRPENVLLLTLAEIMCFIGPFVVLFFGLLTIIPWFVILAAIVTILMLFVSHVLVCVATGVQSWYIAIWSFIPVVLTDLGLMHVSLQRYEFGEVVWKDRNICVPVMHVIPSLPKLNS